MICVLAMLKLCSKSLRHKYSLQFKLTTCSNEEEVMI